MLPGRLSVSRTFGDVEAKIERFNGNPRVVVAVPDIKAFKVLPREHDFIAIASDGVFDKLTNRETAQCVWNSVQDARAPNVHQQTGLGVEYILKNSLLRRSLDNVTVVIISFSNFKRLVFPDEQTERLDEEDAPPVRPAKEPVVPEGLSERPLERSKSNSSPMERGSLKSAGLLERAPLDRAKKSTRSPHKPLVTNSIGGRSGITLDLGDSGSAKNFSYSTFSRHLNAKSLKSATNKAAQQQAILKKQTSPTNFEGPKQKSTSTKNAEVQPKKGVFDFSPTIIKKHFNAQREAL